MRPKCARCTVEQGLLPASPALTPSQTPNTSPTGSLPTPRHPAPPRREVALTCLKMWAVTRGVTLGGTRWRVPGSACMAASVSVCVASEGGRAGDQAGEGVRAHAVQWATCVCAFRQQLVARLGSSLSTVCHPACALARRSQYAVQCLHWHEAACCHISALPRDPGPLNRAHPPTVQPHPVHRRSSSRQAKGSSHLKAATQQGGVGGWVGVLVSEVARGGVRCIRVYSCEASSPASPHAPNQLSQGHSLSLNSLPCRPPPPHLHPAGCEAAACKRLCTVDAHLLGRRLLARVRRVARADAVRHRGEQRAQRGAGRVLRGCFICHAQCGGMRMGCAAVGPAVWGGAGEEGFRCSERASWYVRLPQAWERCRQQAPPHPSPHPCRTHLAIHKLEGL